MYGGGKQRGAGLVEEYLTPNPERADKAKGFNNCTLYTVKAKATPYLRCSRGGVALTRVKGNASVARQAFPLKNDVFVKIELRLTFYIM